MLLDVVSTSDAHKLHTAVYQVVGSPRLLFTHTVPSRESQLMW